MSVSDEKKIGGKLTEQQLAMDLNQLEKRSAIERRPRVPKKRKPALDVQKADAASKEPAQKKKKEPA